MLQWYQACVAPAGHFACEGWGALPLRGGARQTRAAWATLHLQHFKKLVGLRQSVPPSILPAELQESSMLDIWLLRAARFRSTLATSSGLHHRVALDAVRLTVAMWPAA